MAVTIPILPSAGLDETVAFYDLLGFVVDGRWPDEYLILRRPGGIELHFWLDESVERWTNTSSCYIRFRSVADVHALHAAWAGHALPPADLRAPVATDYGMVEGALIDPHGNLLRFGATVG